MQARHPRKKRVRTACLECQRRKQKCNQKQPCSYCLRRYPPVECTYGSTTGDHTKSTCSPGSTIYGANSPGSQIGYQKFEEGKEVKISVDTMDSFANQQSYQRLLSAMVSGISGQTASGTVRISHNRALKSAPAGDQSKEDAPCSVWSSHSMPYARVGTPSTFSISRVDPLHFLGITPTNQSGELLQAFLKVITKYPFSIDGNPSPNYYNDHWVQWSMKSPLLAQLGVFTAACYQAEAHGIPPTKSLLALGIKVKAIGILNDMLNREEMSTSSEAITGVVYLIINEWYWSSYENVQAHMSGLREMVRLRGGLGEMGMPEFLKKNIILVDYYISCSHGCAQSFPHNIKHITSQPAHVSTPLQYSQVQFSSISHDLKISRSTATILDDMRFLIHALIKQVYRSPTSLETLKLTKTFHWIHDRISHMPDGSTKNDPLSTDYLYKSCRTAALIYCKAIVSRIPLSQACTLEDLHQLWTNMWRITLTRWKEIPGIFLFILLSANQAAQTTPHGRFVKSMFKAASSYMALENWEVVDGALGNLLRLQIWLGDGSERVKEEKVDEQGNLPFLHVYGE